MSHAARREQEIAEQIWLVLESIAVAQPDMQMKDGVLLAQKVYQEVTWMREQGISSPPPPAPSTATPNTADPVAFGMWVDKNVPAAHTHLAAGKTIQAIKVVREAAYCGLKEAKDAVEWVRANKEYGTRT